MKFLLLLLNEMPEAKKRKLFVGKNFLPTFLKIFDFNL